MTELVDFDEVDEVDETYGVLRDRLHFKSPVLGLNSYSPEDETYGADGHTFTIKLKRRYWDGTYDEEFEVFVPISNIACIVEKQHLKKRKV